MHSRESSSAGRPTSSGSTQSRGVTVHGRLPIRNRRERGTPKWGDSVSRGCSGSLGVEASTHGNGGSLSSGAVAATAAGAGAGGDCGAAAVAPAAGAGDGVVRERVGSWTTVGRGCSASRRGGLHASSPNVIPAIAAIDRAVDELVNSE